MNITQQIIDFANRRLESYAIRGDELIPEYCPICHGGDNADKYTFALNLTEGVYVCKRGSCGAHGRFEDLVERFGERAELIRPAVRMKKQYELPNVQLLPLTEPIIRYFAIRKISIQTLNAFSVAASADGNILFPFHRDGELVYVKFRAPRKPQGKERKEWQFPGACPILFGMDLCSFAQP